MRAGPLVALAAIAAGVAAFFFRERIAGADDTPAPAPGPTLPPGPAPVGRTPATPASRVPPPTVSRPPAPSGTPQVVVVPPPPFTIPNPSGGAPIVIKPPPFPIAVPPATTAPPAGTPAAPSTLPLRKGSSGALVREVQNRLNAAVGAGLSVTGNFDGPTFTATKKFQSGRKDLKGAPLAVDGIVGPLTYGALLAATPNVTLLSGDELGECIGADEAAAGGAMLRALRDEHPQVAELVASYQEKLGLPATGVYDTPTAKSLIPLGYVPEQPRHFTGKKQLKRWCEICIKAQILDPQRADEWQRAMPVASPLGPTGSG